MSLIKTNDATDYTLQDIEKLIGHRVRVASMINEKCIVCLKKNGQYSTGSMQSRMPMTTEIINNFTKDNLDYYKENFRCDDCGLINVDIELYEP